MMLPKTASENTILLLKLFPVMIYSGGPFKEISRQIIAGHPEEALEPLRNLTRSSDPNIARKAEHNLSVVNEMLENMRIAEEIINSRLEHSLPVILPQRLKV